MIMHGKYKVHADHANTLVFLCADQAYLPRLHPFSELCLWSVVFISTNKRKKIDQSDANFEPMEFLDHSGSGPLFDVVYTIRKLWSFRFIER